MLSDCWSVNASNVLAHLEPGIRLTFPFPCPKLGLEVGQGVEVHAFVLLVQFGRSLLALPDDLLNVVVNCQTVSGCAFISKGTMLRVPALQAHLSFELMIFPAPC
jgi:hypothetical protein